MTTMTSDEIDYAAMVPILAALRSEDSWIFKGACADLDPAIFFGPPDEVETKPQSRHDVREAKRICHSCEVVETCLEFAVENNETYGVWGGMTEKERRKIRRNRRAAERAREEERLAAEAKRRRVIVRREADWR